MTKYDNVAKLYSDKTGNATKPIAIVFSSYIDNGIKKCIIHKHGSPESTKQFCIDTMKIYQDLGVIEDLDDLYYVESDDWNIEELNKCIHSETYLNEFFDMHYNPDKSDHHQDIHKGQHDNKDELIESQESLDTSYDDYDIYDDPISISA